MTQWRDISIGTGGFVATITLQKWNEIVSAIVGILTAIYMAWKVWKDIIKPWLKKHKTNIMAIKQYLDWKGYAKGFYLSWIKTLTNTVLAYVGSNAVGAIGVPNIALSLEQAGGLALSITIVEILHYLNSKPIPDTITETTDTTTIEKP